MKLPFEFGAKLLFRLLLPGFVFSLGLSPLLFFGLDWVSWKESHVYLLIIMIVFSGWALLVLDMPIYMLFEGRRFWLPSLRKWMVKSEKERLEKLLARTSLAKLESIEAREDSLEDKTGQERELLQEQIECDERDYIEGNFDIRNFALNSQGEYQAKFPTRLGNLIYAYEDYSSRVYGMDTMFYWPRIWLKLPKETQEEIDNRQAITDSTVYVSFACLVGAVLWFIYGSLEIANGLIIWFRGSAVFSTNHTLFEHLPAWWFSWVVGAVFLLLGFFVYRLSLRLHAQFGEVFKAVFDDFHDEINMSAVIGDIAKSAKYASLLTTPRKRQMEVAFGYLQFGLINCPSCGKRVTFGKMNEHRKSH
jgi:hypothetical protein